MADRDDDEWSGRNVGDAVIDAVNDLEWVGLVLAVPAIALPRFTDLIASD